MIWRGPSYRPLNLLVILIIFILSFCRQGALVSYIVIFLLVLLLLRGFLLLVGVNWIFEGLAMTTLMFKRKPPDSNTPPSNVGKKSKDQESPTKKCTYLCATCKKQVSDDAVECQWCSRWEHKVCAKITTEEYVLLDSVCDSIMFFCTECTTKVPLALKSYDHEVDVAGKFEALEVKFTTMINDLTNCVKEQAKVFDNKFAGLKAKPCSPDSLNEVGSPLSADSVSNIASSLVEEQHEREKRKLNIIIHNVPESTKDDPAARKNDDIAVVTDLFQIIKHMKIKSTINKAVCIGKKDSSKSRLLKLTVSNIDEKSAILRNNYKFKDSTNDPLTRKIFLTPDLTPFEQKKNKELRTKLADMNKDGNFYKIRNGSIVRWTKLSDKTDGMTKSQRTYKLIVINCRSLQPKKDSFTELIQTQSPHFIASTESWLNPTINSSEIFPPNYQIFRKDRSDGYGGVFFACHNTLNCSQVTITQDCEVVVCKIDLTDGGVLVVVTIYRPPNRDIVYMENLCQLLQEIYTKFKNSVIWIAGDLNLPNINWKLNTIQDSTSNVSIESHNFAGIKP